MAKYQVTRTANVNQDAFETLTPEVQSIYKQNIHLNEVMTELRTEIGKQNARASEIEKTKNYAYTERNQLVAALSKCFPSHLMRHEESDTDWENDWRNIVCIQLPTGQCTWHIHDSEKEQFMHLRMMPNNYDGHTTQEKYNRLDALANLPTFGSPVDIRSCIKDGE